MNKFIMVRFLFILNLHFLFHDTSFAQNKIVLFNQGEHEGKAIEFNFDDIQELDSFKGQINNIFNSALLIFPKGQIVIPEFLLDLDSIWYIQIVDSDSLYLSEVYLHFQNLRVLEITVKNFLDINKSFSKFEKLEMISFNEVEKHKISRKMKRRIKYIVKKSRSNSIYVGTFSFFCEKKDKCFYCKSAT
jgi:hypothetical protein